MSAVPETLCLIPARGGSKGIPGKNLIPVRGKPLVAWSIEHALATPTITRTVVSTDDAEIAAVARTWGAEVVERPSGISGDTATSESALVHALDHLRDAEGYEPARVVFLQATSPLRRPTAIADALAQFERDGADSLFSACRFKGLVWREEKGALSSLTFDYRTRKRRQEWTVDYLENGSIYVFRPKLLRETGNRLGGKISVFVQGPHESIQIDDPGDPEVVAALSKLDRFGAGAPRSLAQVRLLALDFDGVMTDNRALVDQDGREAVYVNRGDGWGLSHLPQDVEALVISTEANPVVSARCRKLGLTCHQAIDDKPTLLKRLIAERGLTPEQVAFVGNDVNDLGCLEMVGTAITPSDAHPAALAVADWVTEAAGGRGVVREVCDALIALKDA